MSAYLTANSIDEKIVRWMANLEKFDRPHIVLAPEKSALLIIDMQRYFINENSGAFLPASRAILPRIGELLEKFRSLDLPIIFTRHAHKPGSSQGEVMSLWWEDLIIDGTSESEIHDGLQPRKREVIIRKDRYSAFCGTNLEKLLNALKVESLILTGVMTNLCCESTARDAFFRDFTIFFIPDGTATLTEEMHFGSLLNLAYGFARIMPAHKLLEFF